jgi:MFS transporter, PHS family, inorganic phosphate transporter
VLQDVEKAVGDARRYRSGKRGEAPIDPLRHARMRADMRKYGRPKPSLVEVWRYFIVPKNALRLLGTAGSWFFLGTVITSFVSAITGSS